jgi:hypothetical protein
MGAGVGGGDQEPHPHEPARGVQDRDAARAPVPQRIASSSRTASTGSANPASKTTVPSTAGVSRVQLT